MNIVCLPGLTKEWLKVWAVTLVILAGLLLAALFAAKPAKVI
jgi:Mg2+ and Co2+ transporter CorA